jgi:hypothetical protein
MPQGRQASVCGSAAGRFAPAAIRYALLSALRSTFPARRPQTEAWMFIAVFVERALSNNRGIYTICMHVVSLNGTIRTIQAAEPRAQPDAHQRFL